jgi:hypothetical protein
MANLCPDNPRHKPVALYTMSPSSGRWQIAGRTRGYRTAREAVRAFQRLHPEQTVAAATQFGKRMVRP